MLKQRVITGSALVVLVFFGVIILPYQLFSALTLCLFIGLAGWEWAKLTGFENTQQQLIFVFALFAFAVSAHLVSDSVWGVIAFASILTLFIIIGALLNYPRHKKLYEKQRWLLRLAAFFVLIPAWFLLLQLHGSSCGFENCNPNDNYGSQFILYLIFLVAIADTGAYFSGKRWGKNKLAPKLSPGKTIEGVLGALIAGMIWALGVAYLSDMPINLWAFFILLSLVTVLVSVAGDLFESLIKREAGQKDSGTILPGHGGILDRIDGLILAIPFFVLGLYFGGLIRWT